jgi:hypothetical protein
VPVVPVVPTPVAGVIPTSELAAICAALTFIMNPPAAVLRQTVGQSITTAVWTSLSLDTSDEDTVSGHSNSVNNSRYTAQYTGWYWVGGSAAWQTNATGARGARLAVNGTATLPPSALQQAIAATFGNQVPVAAQRVFLNFGDFVEIQGFQNSGGNLTTGGAALSLSYSSAT